MRGTFSRINKLSFLASGSLQLPFLWPRRFWRYTAPRPHRGTRSENFQIPDLSGHTWPISSGGASPCFRLRNWRGWCCSSHRGPRSPWWRRHPTRTGPWLPPCWPISIAGRWRWRWFMPTWSTVADLRSWHTGCRCCVGFRTGPTLQAMISVVALRGRTFLYFDNCASKVYKLLLCCHRVFLQSYVLPFPSATSKEPLIWKQVLFYCSRLFKIFFLELSILWEQVGRMIERVWNRNKVSDIVDLAFGDFDNLSPQFLLGPFLVVE